MARKPNSERAKRRNQERQKRNLAAKNKPAAETPKLERARHITQLELLANRGTLSDKRAGGQRRPRNDGDDKPDKTQGWDETTCKRYGAGDRLYRDWRVSGSEPRLVPRYDRTIGLGSGDDAERQTAARFRFERALHCVGPQLRPVIVAVCLLDQSATEWAKLAGKPETDGIPLLRAGLDALVSFYDGWTRRNSGSPEQNVDFRRANMLVAV